MRLIDPFGALAYAALLGIALGCLGWALRVRARLSQVQMSLQSLLIDSANPDGDTRWCVEQLRGLLAQQAARLQQEIERRASAEMALREADERYSMAVRGANDGLWEWNVKTGGVEVSPRWNAMLGLSDGPPSKDFASWMSHVHPEDRMRVETALQALVDGFSPRFESEHRVLHRDGSARWLLSRATAVRNASGSAYRVVGVDADVTRFKRVEDVMMRVAAGTSGATGAAFFQSLVRNFAEALDVRLAFVTECVDFPATRVRALAFWDGSRFADDIEYELEGTPCEHVIKEGRACFYPADLIERFPKEVDSGMQSYFGLPIFDADARVIGHLAFFDDKPMHEGLIVDAVYRIFTARAGAELSRRRVEHAVSDLVLALSEASGAACFRVLVEHFSRLMGAREAFVTECVDGMEPALRVLAWWRDGRHESEQEYSLAQSVCEETIRDGKICVYPDHVGDRFPRARPLDREAYVGVPCFDSSGDVLGHIACCYDQALRRVIPDEPVLKLFAQRAALELEKRRLFTRGAARTSTVSV